MEQLNFLEQRRYPIAKGEIFLKIGNNLTYEDVIKNPDLHKKNLIVDVCSIMIAEWAIADNTVSLPRVNGIMTLAVGTGAIGWDLQNPPAPTAAQTLLESELIRKPFSNRTYVDPILLTPSVSRTNIVDYTTTFLEAEAVGPLVEMGLFAGSVSPAGGTDALVSNSGSMINYLTMSVINKPSTSKLIIVYRLTF